MSVINTYRLINKRSSRKQAGVALISVLLVFALITMLAADMMSQNFRDVKKTQHQHNSKQAYYYALGAEQLARQILHRDYTSDTNSNNTASSGSKSDNFNDYWAQELEGFDINEGEMSFEIIDLQGLINLNNSVDAVTGAKSVSHHQRLERLLNGLGMSASLADAVVDWVDDNQQPSPQGAEDSQYKSNSAPYLAANSEFYDNSELRLLDGMNYENFKELREHVASLPALTPININTATEDVLLAIAPNMKQSDVSQIIAAQQQGGFATINEWLQQSYGAVLSSVQSDLSVNSEYFEIRIKSIYDGRISLLKTTLYRDASDGTMRVIKRQINL